MAKVVNFMTFNVRHDHHPHSIRTPFAEPPNVDSPFDPTTLDHEQPWSIRKWKIVDTILLYSPDVLGLQETVIHQIKDIIALLGDEYEWIGRGRVDGAEEGEMSPILYKKNLLTVHDWKTIWLSTEPEVPGSIGWDAKHPRVATQVTFKHPVDDSTFTVFNAHMDHKGTKAREESSKLLLERARAVHELGPVFLIGDLNSTDDDCAYMTLTNGKYKETKGQNDTLANLHELNEVCAREYSGRTGMPVSVAESHMILPTHRVMRPGQIMANLKKQQEEKSQNETFYFNDSQYELFSRLKAKGAPGTLSGPYGFRDTLTSFGRGDDFDRAPIRIDFIMPLQGHSVKVLLFAVLSNRFDDGLYISDHRPVLAKISW